MQTNRFAYAKLRGRMAEKGYSATALAKALGVSRQTMAKRLNNTQPFNVREMKVVCDYLDIPGEQVAMYFFTE